MRKKGFSDDDPLQNGIVIAENLGLSFAYTGGVRRPVQFVGVMNQIGVRLH